MNNIEFILNTVSKVREIIRIHYPKKYEELRKVEDVWMQVSVGQYQIWVERNIPLSKEDNASILLYSILYGRTVEEVTAFAARKTK